MHGSVGRMNDLNFSRKIRLAVVVVCGVWLGVASMAGKQGISALAAPAIQGIATAGPCDLPTALTPDTVINVRSGPSPDYPALSTLEAGTVVRIVGRHSGLQWWLVELADGTSGWVWDGAVSASGNFADVLLVDAPELNGAVPATADVWEPVAAEPCPATFTPTPSETPAPPTVTPAPQVEGAAATAEPFEEGDWRQPLNLSQSGAVGAPQVVGLSNSTLIFWRDSLDGFFYTLGDGESWSAPAGGGEFPFHTRRYSPDIEEDAPTPSYPPRLFAGAGNVIHALWRDSEGILYHSRALVADFGNFEGWTARQQVIEAAAEAALAVDASNRLHLVYVRSSNQDGLAAGVYYQQSTNSGQSWSQAINLYASPYLRLLTPEEANIHIEAPGGGNNVYVTWDEPARDRVFFTHSGTGGTTWESVQEVDRRRESDSSSAAGPSRIELLASGSAVHLTWQAGHEGISCSQYHRWSEDGGESWVDTTQPLAGTVDGCPSQADLLAADGRPMLLAAAENGTYLVPWTDNGWAEPQFQAPLGGFSDPATFRQVTLNCGQDASIQGTRMLLAACGQGAGNDVWLLQRDLGPLLALVGEVPVWTTPAPVLEENSEDEGPGVVADPILLGGADGVFHAFWTEAGAAAASPLAPEGAALGQAIVYARWSDGRWSRPIPILSGNGSEGGASKAIQPAVAFSGDGRLLAVWSGGSSGEILYSWADASRASVASEWVTPIPLPAPVGAGAPDILVDRAGVVYVVYAVSLNEERGIYLTVSSDGGDTWSPAERIFDAAAAGWQRVDGPQLALTANEHLHLLWQQQALPDNAPATALHYAYSRDGGLSWSEPDEVENGTPERGPVVWADVVGIGALTAHRVWQEWDGNRLNLWHQVSTDDGLSWSRAARVGGFSSGSGPVTLAVDGASQLYLLQVADGALQTTGAAETTLQQWQWLAENQRWEAAESLALARDGNPEALASALAAAIGADGSLAALVVGQRDSRPQVWYAGRTVTLPDVLPTPLPSLTPSPTPVPEVTATPVPAATVTPVFPTEFNPTARLDIMPTPAMNDMLFGAILALIPGLLLAEVVVLVVVRLRVRR